MEVSYTDHSHIIGRGGNTISRVMEETRCHVHFPDSNRTNQTEKSNLVTVAGELAGVEKARARVRVRRTIPMFTILHGFIHLFSNNRI
jgi:protein bicaudal C